MTVRDFRNAGWCWQEKAALVVLRAYYDGDRLKQRSTAIAVYVALTEAASNQHQQGEVEVVQMALAGATGTSRSTVKRYLVEFETIGLVRVERRKTADGISLPNIYILLTPPSTDGPLLKNVDLRKETKEGAGAPFPPLDPAARWLRAAKDRR